MRRNNYHLLLIKLAKSPIIRLPKTPQILLIETNAESLGVRIRNLPQRYLASHDILIWLPSG